jgi:hypothetical protein
LLRERIAIVPCLLLGLLGGAPRATGAADLGPAPPEISAADQKFITWIVRRTLEQRLADGSTYALPPVPPRLADLPCQIAVTLREGGRAWAVGTSPRTAVVEAAQKAAGEALQAAAQVGTVDADTLARLCIEIEAIGDVVPAPVVPYWGSVQSYTFLEPGVHGIILQLREATGALRPSEFISNYPSVGAALRSLNERMNPAHESHQGAMASWFRTTHWYELEPRGDVVQLRRGLLELPPEAVTEAALREATRTLAAYMVYRQKPDGELSYQFEPGADAYTSATNCVRQAEAAAGLARYARQRNSKSAGAAAEKALRLLTKQVVPLRDVEGAGYFRGPDSSTDLGATALLALALTDHPHPQPVRPVRDQLVTAMLWLQKPSGEFITVFPPALVETGQETYPGQALCALAAVREERLAARARTALAAAFPVYREDFRKSPSLESAAWQTQAFTRLAQPADGQEYADYIFAMNDWLIGCQRTSANCAWPDLYGAIDPPGREGPGAATALALQGLTEALALARQRGDTARATRYEPAVRAATRFVLQLQFRREEGFYVRSPRDCYGGIRNALWDNRIRIDHCGQALTALERVREVLFPDH